MHAALVRVTEIWQFNNRSPSRSPSRVVALSVRARRAATRVRRCIRALARRSRADVAPRAARATLTRALAFGYFSFHIVSPLRVSFRKVRVSTRARATGSFLSRRSSRTRRRPRPREARSRANLVRTRFLDPFESPRARSTPRARRCEGNLSGILVGTARCALVFVDDRRDRTRARREIRAREGR